MQAEELCRELGISDIDEYLGGYVAGGYSGATSLYNYANKGDLNMVKRLVEAGANIQLSQKGTGYTPLHIATDNNDTDIVAFLLEARAEAPDWVRVRVRTR